MTEVLSSAQDKATNIAEESLNIGQGIGSQILEYLGNAIEWITPVLSALAILIIGGFIIRKAMKILKSLFEKAKIDNVLEKIGLTGELQNLGIKITATSFIVGIISLVAKFVLWMSAINILGIDALTNLMNDILLYIPNILIALILLFAGITISKFVKELIQKSASSISVSEKTAQLLGKIAKGAILTLTVLSVLSQLNIATDLVNTLFQGVVFGLTIAGGIAFGLGGQEKAKEIINNIGK